MPLIFQIVILLVKIKFVEQNNDSANNKLDDFSLKYLLAVK